MYVPRLTTLALVAGLGLTAAAAQPPDAGQALPRTIDVIAADGRGRRVDTLTARDFAILQDGQPLSVASAEFVREPARAVGIFLDEFHTPAGAAADQVRAALLTFVRTTFTPDDRIAIVKPLDSLLSIAWSDRDAAAAAIERFEGRQGDYTPRSDFERRFLAGDPARLEAARNQIALSALNALAIHLGTAPQGRKALVVLSGALPPRSRSRGDAPLPTLESVVRAANRNRVSVYPIRIGAVPDADAGTADPDGLATLALQTAGRPLPLGDALAAGLTSVLADATDYYLLTLQPDDQWPDDRFHPVDITTPRRGVTLRARPGYWAAVPDVVRAPRAGRDPVLPRVPNKISPLVRPWFGMAPGRDGATQVSFVWEPAPRVPGDRSRVPPPARVSLNAARADTGETVFEGAVLPANGAAGATEAAPTRATFELPPGRLRVSMSIQDAASQQIDTDIREVMVGSFPGPLTLGTLQVLRARTAREFRTLSGSAEAAPAVARQFSRSERLLIRVPTLSRGSVPAVSAQLVSRFGASRPLAVEAWAESGYQMDVPLAGLAAGEYVVEVSATNDGGTARDSVAFRVTP